MKDNKKNVAIAIFAAIIVVLQLVATFINFGSFPITLTLIPIIVAGAIYGPAIGALMGTVFGVIVALMVITGADPSGATMLAIHPVITISVCILKGTLCGLCSALTYKALKNKNEKLAIVLASAVAPIVNTGTLFICLILFFESNFATMVSAFMSINFLIELLTNVLLAPGLLGIIHSSARYN
ncbi:MAG: ECF transporter S component [Erysipelotrichaceae bacterium]|nr:ECF transporter S component [Erysipelotrichaceae bacterium]